VSEQMPTVAWLVTHIGDKAALEAWQAYQREKERKQNVAIGKLQGIQLRIECHIRAINKLIEMDRHFAEVHPMLEGRVAAHCCAARMGNELQEWQTVQMLLQDLQKDLLAILGR
jgi:hypothetical protein